MSDSAAGAHPPLFQVSDICSSARNFDLCVVFARVPSSCSVPVILYYANVLVQFCPINIHFVTYFEMVLIALIYSYSSFQDFWFSPYSLSWLI